MRAGKKRKSWSEKLRASRPFEVKPAPVDMAGMKAGQMMLLPSPAIVDAFLRTIPEGSGMDVKGLRKSLAVQYGAEVTCPIVMGFQLRIAAEAACEALAEGAAVDSVTPFWRVMDEHSNTAKKLGCGTAFIREQRFREGLGKAAARAPELQISL